MGREVSARVAIIGCGFEVGFALQAKAELEEEGIHARVLDMHTIKPIDEEVIAQAAQECGAIVTAEEHLLDGGLGARVAQAVAKSHPVPMEMVGVRDTYAESKCRYKVEKGCPQNGLARRKHPCRYNGGYRVGRIVKSV